MSGLSPATRERLARMGIDRWELRPGVPSAEDLAKDAEALCIRLLSGSGDWVLVQRQAWRGDHAALMADIQATLGPDRCRFGQWVEAGSAGVGPAELQARGVKHILSFGEPPELIDWPMLVQGPGLEELVRQPEARRVLWGQLAPLIEV